MSFLRKNARRLRGLRRHGVPINPDYTLAQDWGVRMAGERIDEKTQKEWLAQLQPDKPKTLARPLPKGLRRGRVA
jgi:hypothetical protein